MRILRILSVVFLTVCLYQSCFACGVPQDVYGRATGQLGGIPNARITLIEVNGDLIYSARTNPFGYYLIRDVTPCVMYEISITAKSAAFVEPVRVFYVAGDGEGYEVNFQTTEAIY